MRVYAVTRQQAMCKFALQRCKSKTIARIAFKQKLNEVIAESANAVVKNDWVGIDVSQGVRRNDDDARWRKVRLRPLI